MCCRGSVAMLSYECCAMDSAKTYCHPDCVGLHASVGDSSFSLCFSEFGLLVIKRAIDPVINCTDFGLLSRQQSAGKKKKFYYGICGNEEDAQKGKQLG